MYLLLNLAIYVFGGVVGTGVIPAVLIFGLAGRWDLWNVWAYLGIVVGWFSFQSLALSRKNPDLLREQMKPSGGELRGRLSLRISAQVMSLLVFSVAGLDQRFHWSDIIPPAAIVAGLVIAAIGLGLYTWAMVVNPFFSFLARVQADRGQQIVSTGPYAIVGHPGYAGVVLRWVATGVALNSLLSIIPALVVGAMIGRATALEDRMLQNELAGYDDYGAKVCYRLIPGVW
jgi:protein-S-isoprenylcysteine O-methyltransferase Ste14